MHIHASCAARDGHGVLLLGPPGIGKSDLLLRLIGDGFQLVADDRVEIAAGQASPPPELAGLLEVRGLGILRLAHVAPVPLTLAIRLARSPEALGERLPLPFPTEAVGVSVSVPVLVLDGSAASAVQRVGMALDCATGRIAQLAGGFAA